MTRKRIISFCLLMGTMLSIIAIQKLNNIEPISITEENVDDIITHVENPANTILDSNTWEEFAKIIDADLDGIADNLEDRINVLLHEEKSGHYTSIEDKILTTEEVINELMGNGKKQDDDWLLDQIPIVLNIPSSDIEPIKEIFDKLGGSLKSTYTHACKGFSGSISHEGLVTFQDQLNQMGVTYIIEEDGFYDSNLYFTSRNMNLRPYTWNTLGFSGDNQGSIAVIDTGIDDSHNFFAPGYSEGDSSYKIVGWHDAVSGQSQPYDDAGHGSHCAGIATGIGGPETDFDGRTVATFGIGLDYTGYYLPEQTINITAARFNNTHNGEISIKCEMDDFTPSPDAMRVTAYLYHEETLVDTIDIASSSWVANFTHVVSDVDRGDYSLRLSIFCDGAGDMIVLSPHFRFRGEIHWHFNPSELGGGDKWKGIAPDAQLVGVKVLNAQGGGSLSDIVDGLNWIIANKNTYNITTISMSLGGGTSMTLISAVTSTVDNGIVTVVSAGNSGPGGNFVGSPGDADKVITVAAMGHDDRVASYSSQGGDSYTGVTTKPDIMAPGGSYFNYSMFSTDTNDNDANMEFPTDSFANDLAPMQGTSMAAPAVAGAANLVIQAMGGYQNWNYTVAETNMVKALLLMSATEVYPLPREEAPGFSPTLERGGKDVHEGYGRINVDAALEALTQELLANSSKSDTLACSSTDSFARHALGCHVMLNAGQTYSLSLKVPAGADFDLHLYEDDSNMFGEPEMIASSTSPVLGKPEVISFTPTTSGRYFLIAKAISGSGVANLTFTSNLNAPTLTGEALIPSFGTQTTLFNFSVIYSDIDNNAPSSIDVLINSSVYPMVQEDPLDFDYSGGVTYQLLTYLQPGTYSYHMECFDGLYNASTSSHLGPDVFASNTNSPSISDGQVNPASGYANNTVFDFTVNYSDPDNNAPDSISVTINSITYPLSRLDLLDENYMDGCLFGYSTTLDAGTYTYQFNCSDGTYDASDGPYTGPTVIADALSDGLTIEHIWDLYGTAGPSSTTYTHLSGNLYQMTWTHPFGTVNWNVDTGDRIMQDAIGAYNFGSGFHDPFWIYPDTQLWEVVPIAVDGIGDQSFQVTGDTIFKIPGYGIVEVWELQDLGDPNAKAWYEKSTGILLNGTFWWMSMAWYRFDFVGTNANMTVLKMFLEDGGVSPINGSSSMPYNFTVKYVNLDNIAPSSVEITLSSNTYSMAPVNPLDTNYTDGAVYQYVNSSLTPQTYNFSFKATAGSESVIYPMSGLPIIGPHVMPYEFSKLLTGNVDPRLGDETGDYTFWVNYQDTQNNTPEYVQLYLDGNPYSMTKDPLDDDFTNGVKYTCLNSSMLYTTHSFYFVASNFTDILRYPEAGSIQAPSMLKNYTMIANYSYMWIDAQSGYRCNLAGWDDGYERIDLPFNFTFYNETFDYIYVCTNGFASFVPDASFMFEPFPTASHRYMIAPFWSDLNTDSPCNMHVRNVTWPFECVVIQWTDIDSLFGGIVGSFQIILFENGNIMFNYDYIASTPGGYTCGLNFGQDTSYYNQFTGLVPLMDDFSIFFSTPFNYNPPELIGSSVIPSTGDQLTIFNFMVNYIDIDNNIPEYVNVIINGTAYPMIVQDPIDFDHTDGKIYECSLLLQPGTYDYFYKCYDGRFYNSTANFTGLVVSETNVFAPRLINASVNPLQGSNETIFEFSVVYFDDDNNFPQQINVSLNDSSVLSMLQVDPLDTNAFDGVLYSCSTTLDFGDYQFQMNCTDGTFTNSTGWNNGPEVSPFFGGGGGNLIVINEIYAGAPDAIEIYNYGPDQDLTGWYLSTYDTSSLDIIYYFPIGFTIPSHTVVQIIENTGVNTPTTLYTGGNIMWHDRPLACGLFNDVDANMDWVQANGYTTPFPADAEWTDDSPLVVSENYAYRISDIDNNLASDWNTGLTGSLGTLNPGQTGSRIGGSVIFLSSPLNGSTEFNGMINFTWMSLELSSGPIDYELQISDSTDFSSVFYNITGIPETPGTTVQPVDVNLSTGVYYWRVRAEFFGFFSNWSDYHVLNLVENDFAPVLSGGTFNPSTGDQSTIFTFLVNYTDLDNNFPVFMNVLINGSLFTMTKQNPGDLNYVDGCIYQYQTTLAPGNYNYSFECGDGIFNASTTTYTNLTVTESNNFAPSMVFLMFGPMTGYANSTVFSFQTDYFDADNNAPTYVNITFNSSAGTFVLPMSKFNYLDIYYVDGCSYGINTTLDAGVYNFWINCSDGIYNDSTYSPSGPIVSPVQVHSPIFIDGNAELDAFCAGNGTDGLSWSTAHVIRNYFIDGGMTSTCIEIRNTDRFLIIQNCELTNSSWNNEGINILNCENINITGCTITYPNQIGIMLTYALNCYVNSCYVEECYDQGIYVIFSSDVMLINNTAYDNYVGIWMEGSSNSFLANNSASMNYGGILLMSSSGNTVFNNTLINNYDDGVYIYNAFNNNVSMNTLQDADYGVRIQGSSSNNLICWNRIQWNSYSNSMDESTGTGNLWDDGFNGNYWGDYTSRYPGATSNGILWDTPYLIDGTSIQYDNVPLVSWPNLQTYDYEPNLTAGNVVPNTGDETTLLNFSVIYMDQDNNIPVYVNVSINGTLYAMQKVNIFDNNYVDGVTYQFMTYLSPGTYNYQFSCADLVHSNVTAVYSNLSITTTNAQAPTLTLPSVSPTLGIETTIFNFTALYTDGDNNMPVNIDITINSSTYGMNKADPLDSNAMDGIIYYYATTLAIGDYQFQVSCSDGVYSNATSWIFAPQVTPFAGPPNATLFHEDFEGDLSNWDSITGMWHLTDNTSVWPNSYHSPVHSMWFGQESSGTYANGSRAYGELVTRPIDLSGVSEAYLELFNWLQGEGSGWDVSFIYASTNNISWDFLYENYDNIMPWEKLVFDISMYCGTPTFYLRFFFDTMDSIANSYRGWLIDDIVIYSNGTAPYFDLLTPLNGSTHFNENINFTWKSIELSQGSSEYIWQISNTSDFAAILDEQAGIAETPGVSSIYRLVNFSTGQYFWRVGAEINGLMSNWSRYSIINLIHNDAAPNLLNGMVNPATGDQFTLFNFSVNYTDIDNNQPIFMNLTINGTDYTMSKVNSLDNNYTDGCTYQFLTNLPPGIYSYTFHTNDSLFASTAGPYSLTVTKANTNPPILSGGSVGPNSGFNDTTVFLFLVNYLDLDNNEPDNVTVTINGTTHLMGKQNPLDVIYSDGCVYTFTTMLSLVGNYIYHFNCSDGLFTEGDGPYTDLTVYPFTNIYFDGMYYDWSAFFNWTMAREDGRELFVNVAPDEFDVQSTSSISYRGDRRINAITREIVDDYDNFFVNNSHEWTRIYPYMAIGSEVLISVIEVGDQLFTVTGETMFVAMNRLFDCWILQSPEGSIAYYHKTSGVLINGTFKMEISSIPYEYSIQIRGSNIVPVSDFTANATVVNINEVIQFTFTGQEGRSPASYEWDFGDGTANSTLENPTHQYISSGFFTVTLTVTDDDGNIHPRSYTNFIFVMDLFPLASYSTNVSTYVVNESIQFNFTGNYGDLPATFLWDFGDGTNSTLENPTHVYNTTGIFILNLTITDFDGDFDTIINPIIVDPDLLPFANFSANITSIIANQWIAFTFNGNLGNAPSSFQWDFGDSTPNSTLQSPMHQYTSLSNYTVTLTVVDSDGDANTTVKINYIQVIADIAPVASFVANETVIIAGESVQFNFTGIEGNAPANYSWDFGDNGTSTVQNATHQYLTPGNYTVMLTVTDYDGDSNSSFIVDYITVEADIAPIADFSANATIIGINEWVQFTFNGSLGNQPASFQWDFGDGTSNSTLQDPSHQYTITNNFTVTLTVFDRNNDSHTEIKLDYIIMVNLVPIANFSSNATTVVEGQWVQFNFTGFPGDPPIACFWDFDDGSNSTLVNPAHQFSTPGNYTIIFTVNDTDNDTDTMTAVNYITVVNDTLPTANFSAVNNTIIAGQSVQFNFTGNEGNAPATYLWDFGDGNGSVQRDPLHQYLLPGNYTINLTVVDIDGDEDNITLVDYIEVIPDIAPISDFTANVTSIIVDQSVQFNFTGNVGNAPATFQWNFGDGPSNSTATNPVHQYNSSGNYTVTLTVFDADGDSHTTFNTSMIDVEPDLVPFANFTSNTTTIIAGQWVQFNFTGSEGNAPATFLWDFGDTGTSILENPTHQYTSSGNYTVSLVVQDANGDTNSTSIVDYIIVDIDLLPVASFIASPTNITASQTVQFNYTGTHGNGIVSYSWSFGDNGTSTIGNATHQYLTPGVYTVSLTVVDIDGDSNSTSIPNCITVSPDMFPVANFSVNDTSILRFGWIQFNFTGSEGNSPATFQWDFGDSGTSILENPDHQYTTAGNFTVSLLILDSDGDFDIIAMTNIIEVVPNIVPVVNFTVNFTTIEAGDWIQFTFTGIEGNGPSIFLWDFGDGTPGSSLRNPSHQFNNPGEYTITLTVTDQQNDTDSEIKVHFITVIPSEEMDPILKFLQDNMFFLIIGAAGLIALISIVAIRKTKAKKASMAAPKKKDIQQPTVPHKKPPTYYMPKDELKSVDEGQAGVGAEKDSGLILDFTSVEEVKEPVSLKQAQYTTKLICPDCKDQYDVEDPTMRFSCPNCTRILNKIIICPNCGKRILIDFDLWTSNRGKEHQCYSCNEKMLL